MTIFRVLHPHYIKRLEDDAKVQAKFHIVAMYFWLVQMFAVAAYVHQSMPHTAQTWLFLYITEISLAALVSTEFGALAASQASLKADGLADPDEVAQG